MFKKNHTGTGLALIVFAVTLIFAVAAVCICAAGEAIDQATCEHECKPVTTVAPTCSESGYTLQECAKCGLRIKTDVVAPLGHDFDIGNSEGYIQKYATCEESGVTRYVCKRCGTGMDVTTPPTGHSWGDGETVSEPTCEKDGEKKYTCPDCQKTKTEVLPQLGHDFSDAYTADVPATCTVDGKESRHCTRCGAKTDERTVEALGHSFSPDYYYDVEDCSTGGTAYRKCTRCGEKTDVIDVAPAEHTWAAEDTIDKSPTCTEDGQSSVHCLHCNAKKDVTVIPAEGHVYDAEYIIKEQVTCTTPGRLSRKCIACGEETDLALIPPLGHDWSQPEIIRPATCIESGESRRTCSRCGLAETETIPLAPHTKQGVPVTTMATCTTQGYNSYICSVCGKPFDTDHTPALGHSFDTSKTVIVAPSCANEGSVTQICSVCGEITETKLPASGHKYGGWTVSRNATLLKEGEKQRTCSVCGGIQTQVIPKLESITVTDPATGVGIIASKSDHPLGLTLKVEAAREQIEGLEGVTLPEVSIVYKVEVYENGALLPAGEEYLLLMPIGSTAPDSIHIYYLNPSVGLAYPRGFAPANGYAAIVASTSGYYAVCKGTASGSVMGNDYIAGDVDGDGSVTAADARAALRFAAKLDVPTEETYDVFSRADLNSDGVVTADEARKILRAAAKLEAL